MIKKLHISIVSILMIGLMFSCSTSNDVASNRGIQKRKYNKGFYVEKGPKLGGKTNKTELADNDLNNEVAPIEVATVNDRISSTPEVIKVEEINDETAIVEELVEETSAEEVIENETVNEQPNIETAQQNLVVEKNEVKKSTKKLKKETSNFIKRTKNKLKNQGISSIELLLLIIIAILLPWLAVGLVTGWDPLLTIISVLLWCLFLLPGIIFAIIVVMNNA